MGQIRDHFDVAPTSVEHQADLFEVAKFEKQAAAGFQKARGFRDETGIDRETVRAGEECKRGFVIADLALQRKPVGFGNVRRVGDDQIEGLVAEGGAEIALDEVDESGQAARIVSSDVQRRRRNVRRGDASFGLKRQRDRDGAGARYRCREWSRRCTSARLR